MGKLFVPDKIRTPADEIRKALDEAERRVVSLHGTGPDALEVLGLFDQIAQGLDQLEEDGVDVRAERTRFESLQGELQKRKRRFLAEVGEALQKERAIVQPDSRRWWWYLDEAAAQQRRRTLLQILAGAAAMILLLIGAWQAYDHFLAPPPEVRQANRLKDKGEMAVREGNLETALEAFSTVTTLTPDDARSWLWKGTIHAQQGDAAEMKAAFETAHALYESDFAFFLNRGRIYLLVGDLSAAEEDARRTIEERPSSGWGYYLRAGVAAQQGNPRAAYEDLEKAEELAQKANDGELMAMARTQRAIVQEKLPTPTP